MTNQQEDIMKAAAAMIEEGFIAETEDSQGNLVWTITKSGRDHLARLQEYEVDE